MAPPERLFFAAWPPASVCDAITQRVHGLHVDGRRVARERLHLTLAFHGLCDAQARAALIARADALQATAFDLRLDRVGQFGGGKTLWLAPTVVPDALQALAQTLGATLDERTYRPHVTISRKAAPITPRPIAPIDWRIEAFALVASGHGGAPGGYRDLARWRLADAPARAARM